MSRLAFENAGEFEIASCPGQEALEKLEELRHEGRSAGFSTILLGGQDDADSLAENREFSNMSAKEILRSAAEVDVKKWLQQQIETDPEHFQPTIGTWPWKVPDAGGISAHLEILSRKPREIVYLAKVPTSDNWQVPAYIGMGGWNECPEPAVLTAFAKYWHERYGSWIVSITRDVMEFTVARPPTTKESAVELAREQYIFCSDIVDQGVGDVTTLAATLLGSDYWYFWWD